MADEQDNPQHRFRKARETVRALDMHRPRRVIYVDETMQTPQGIVPHIVVEGEAGMYATTWQWGDDMAKAKAWADDANTRLGYSRDEVLDVVASSMAASEALRRGKRPCPQCHVAGGHKLDCGMRGLIE